MAGQHLVEQKKYRIEELSLQGEIDRADRIAYSDTYTPIFNSQSYHSESELDVKELNNDLKDIINDLGIIEVEFVILAQEYEKLLSDSIKKIEASRREVFSAREKLTDLNMLCPEGSDFFQVNAITNELFEDANVVNEDGTITAKAKGSKKVECKIEDVVGNGTEGNEHVYVNGKFVYEDSYTGLREYMVDNNIATIYEYQKLNASTTEEYGFADLSFSSTEAFCTISLVAEEALSFIKITSPDENVIIQGVQVSADGEEYTPVLKEEIQFNKKEKAYKNPDYIYESGIIAFPLSRYIKITLSSDGYTNESIGYYYESL